jgi:hypothetical protein
MRTPPRQHVLENFVEKYGRQALRRLLTGFEQNVSGPILAKEMGVSRERIRQWKALFGTSVQVYTLHSEARALNPNPVQEKIMTEDYFVKCLEGKEREDGSLLVQPEADIWEVWIPCGNASGKAEMLRGEEGDRVYRGKWYRLSFHGAKELAP